MDGLKGAHAKLWADSQTLTAVLVDLYYQHHGCCCNPGISHQRANHVCLPLRQLAMLQMRIPGTVFFPIFVTDAALTSMFQHLSDRPGRFALEKMLIDRTFARFWTDVMMQLLRDRCVLCDQHLHPAQIHQHYHEAHGGITTLMRFYMKQLHSSFAQIFVDDFSCPACEQIFNTADGQHDPDLHAARHRLVQIHLQAQCPNLLQASALLASVAYGGSATERDRRRGEPTGLSNLSEHAPALVGQDIEAGGPTRSGQATKKRRTQGIAKSRSRPTIKSPVGEGASSVDTPDGSDGQGHATAESRGHLYLLFQQQRTNRLLATVAENNGDLVCLDPEADASQTATHAGDDERIAHTGTGHRECKGGLRPLTNCSEEQPDPSGSQLSIPGVGPCETKPDDQSSLLHQLEAHGSDMRRAPGDSDGCGGCSTFSCTPHEAAQQHIPLEASDLSAPLGTVATTAGAVPVERLDASRDLHETAFDSSKSAGSAAPNLNGNEPFVPERSQQRESGDTKKSAPKMEP